MGILDKQRAREQKRKQELEKKVKKQKEEELKRNQLELNKSELKYLLKTIAKAKFEGLEMQIIYSITAKLQNQLKK